MWHWTGITLVEYFPQLHGGDIAMICTADACAYFMLWFADALSLRYRPKKTCQTKIEVTGRHQRSI
ncbi:hypothetical protein BV25DRAFT_1819186 [Artomyces pyxidatus]|uniref:Uncharacterized protein n=1 Tax=Artomyces pyxidatus TaxID=48021 RepID=A0ACB8TH83_9AGAM|nr:hypothetical protein BV25DRAFT_1819186 [Artomyces pyxidatus]